MRIRRAESTYNTDVAIDSGYPLVCILLQQLRGDELLQCQDDTIATSDTDASATVFDSLHGIFDLDWVSGDALRSDHELRTDLEVTSIGREDRVLEIVARSYRSLEKDGQRLD